MERNQDQNQDPDIPKKPGRQQDVGASSKQRDQDRRSHEARAEGGNPQSDRSYHRTETGTHKSKLGGVNRQAGSSRSNSSQSSDSPLQSGDTGTDEDAGKGDQTRGGGAGRASQKPGI